MRQFTAGPPGDPGGPLVERGVTEMVAEAFRIYRRRWREFLWMSALVHAPIAVIDQLIGTGAWAITLVIALSLLGSAAFFGAAVSAVCQHYLLGRVDVGTAYRRAQWRYVSILAVTVLTTAVVVGGALLVWIVVPFIAAVVYAVYWSVAAPAVIVEGHKPVDALKRSFGLVRGSWWRTFGASMAFVLVAVGMSLIGWMPYWIADWSGGGDSSATVGLRWIGQMVVAVGVPPILAICWTLLYYDIRIRKEELSLARLGEELGLAGPGGPPGASRAGVT